MAEASGSGSIAQSECPTFWAMIGEAVGLQILGHNGNPPGDTSDLSIGLIGVIMRIGLCFDETEVSCLFSERSLVEVEDPVEVPSGCLNDADHGSGPDDFAIEGENLVLVTGVAASDKDTISPF